MERLPQTQEELENLSIDSCDYQIKEYIKDLFLKNKASKTQVMDEIIKFFRAYDASRDLNILILKKQVLAQKRENQKLKTSNAFDYSEKAEIENLFLDCIEQTKKEHHKIVNARIGLHTGPTEQSRLDHLGYGV